MSASLVYHSKVTLVHRRTETVAVAELVVWRVPKSQHFPEGLKYSLFLVNRVTGKTLIGYDNHKPKGHHVHVGDTERAYDFKDIDTLINDFWSNVEEQGYLT